jgi:photosystem II stability/assembly factor-like uncharacterized protein
MKAFTAAMCAALVASQVDVPIHRWEAQESGVTARLRGVSAVNSSVAWASGANGTVLRTSDSSGHWETLTVPDAATLDFRDVDAITALTAYVLSIGNGTASRIYKTQDGGGSWTLQFTNQDPKAFFDAMAFWDERSGIVMGDSIDGRFDILRTMDGGTTWARVPASALPPALPNEGAFAGSGTNVAVGTNGEAWIGTGAASRCRVLHTKDYGATWTVVDTPVAGSASAGIFSIAFRDAHHGMVVGGDYRKEGEAVDNAAITHDGGATWTKVTGLRGFRSVVASVPGTEASWIAVGPSGADLSNDDGKTWTAVGDQGFHAFSFARDRAIGWGVGEKGRIARFGIMRRVLL